MRKPGWHLVSGYWYLVTLVLIVVLVVQHHDHALHENLMDDR